MVADKRFRLDLLHRMNTLHIHIPPLRERPEDIEPLLVQFVGEFASRMGKITPEIPASVLEALKAYSFPGNVRELRNITERAMIFCKGDRLSESDFITKPNHSTTPALLPPPETAPSSLGEADQIREKLKACNYNQTETAAALGITRDALIRKMKKYGISVSRVGL
jgi:DNA-binding NtrC family response regulator